MTDEAREPWVMPKWMEPYRDLFQNTGGNSIEDLMNDHSSGARNNVVRAALIVAVASQVDLLRRLKYNGMLVTRYTPEAAPEVGEMVLIDAMARCDGDGVAMVLTPVGSDGSLLGPDYDISPDKVHWHPAK